MAEKEVSQSVIANRKYIGPGKTGDNIDADRSAQYGFDATAASWSRQPILSAGLINSNYDSVAVSTVGSVSTYSFYHGGLSGTLVNTLTLTFTDSTLSTLVSIVKT